MCLPLHIVIYPVHLALIQGQSLAEGREKSRGRKRGREGVGVGVEGRLKAKGWRGEDIGS